MNSFEFVFKIHRSIRFQFIFLSDSNSFSSNTQIECISTDLAKQCASIDKDETVDLTFMSSVETLFKSLACINGSFLKLSDQHMCCTSKNPGIDVADAEIAFDNIRKMENSSLKSIVSNNNIKTVTKTVN